MTARPPLNRRVELARIGMGKSRISIAGSMVAVAMVGAGLASIETPSDGRLIASAYVNAGAAVAATFLARFGDLWRQLPVRPDDRRPARASLGPSVRG